MTGIAIIGTGYWGKNHLRVFKELKSENTIDELIICDIDEARSEKFAKIFDISWTRDYRQLLTDKSIDAVSIVTPSKTHYVIAREFMEAGKDVFVEKPMTMNSHDARELVKVAERTNRILMVGHVFRYHPAIRELKKRMDRKDFGDIFYMATNRYSYAAPRKDMGVLFALAIHEVDIYCYLLNETYPLEITAIVGTYLQQNIEETAMISMRFPHNVHAYAFESWLTPGSKSRELFVVGSKMCVKIDYLRPQELRVIDASISTIERAGEIFFHVEDEGSYTIPIPYREPLKEELAHFVECIKTRATPLADMYAGLRAVEMIEWAIRSAREGCTIKLHEYLNK
jgi:predicted dehydrogenase